MKVLCVNCDRPLDLTTTNWLINTRPWCPTCAAPHIPKTGTVEDMKRSLWDSIRNQIWSNLDQLEKAVLDRANVDLFEEEGRDFICEAVPPEAAAERLKRFAR